MNKLQLPHSKLLYVIGQAYRKRKIDENEKRMLKEKVITDNVEIFEVLQKYENEAELLDQLVDLVKVSEHEPNFDQTTGLSVIIPDHAVPDPAQEEASSPWGNFLRWKKVNRQSKDTNKNVMMPQKT